jgi:hypothetical protein
MESKYKKYVVVSSLIITLAIFSAGFLIGKYLDSYRFTDVVDTMRESEINTESYVVEQQFIEKFGGRSCELLRPRLIELSRDLSTLGQSLTLYESGAMLLNERDYDYLKRRYFVLEARTYMYELHAKNTCGDNRTLILFFYSGQNEVPSIKQGYVLDDMYREYKNNISIHSFDINFQNSTITDILEKYYNISEAPTLVINDKVIKKGFVDMKELDMIMRNDNMSR